jgi:hypothetical protein
MKKYISLGEFNGADPSKNISIVHFFSPIGDGHGKLKRMIKYVSTMFENVEKRRKYVENEKVYSSVFEWNDSSFLISFKRDGTLKTTWFGGEYYWIENDTMIADFGNARHIVRFDPDFKTFLSLRKNDGNIVHGKLFQIEKNPDYEFHNSKKTEILKGLHDIIVKTGSFLEGNSFYIHGTLNLYTELYTKQVNLFLLGKRSGPKICEIGFNAGHSTMLMLLGRCETTPTIFTVFDIGHHAYTKPCLEYIRQSYPNVDFQYVEGDSTQTMPAWIEANKENSLETYDLIHVDGGHDEHCISNDMKNADLLVKIGGVIIIDDTWSNTINAYIDK